MNVLLAFLIWLALAVAQALIGGTRQLFSLPAYAILGLAGVLSLIPAWRRPASPRKEKQRGRGDALCIGAATLFALVVAGRALGSPVEYLARPDLLLAGGALVVYLLSASRVAAPRGRLRVVVGGLLLAVAQLAVGAVQFVRGDDFMLIRWDGTVLDFLRPSDYRGRASGFYICPNHLAGLLEVVGSLTLAVALWSRLPLWLKLLLGYGAAGCFAGLLLTGSRGGFLSAAVALGTLALLSLWRARGLAPERARAVTLATLVAALVVAGGSLFLIKKSVALQKRAALLTTASQTDVRPALWAGAWRQFRTAPLAGTGSGTTLFYSRLLREPRVQADPVHAHGDYLELLGEYGLAGALALAVFLGAHLRAGWRHFHALGPGADAAATSNAAALNLGALAALASFLAHSAVDFNLHIPANALLLAWVCGLLAHPGRDLAERAPREEPAGFLRALTRVWLRSAPPAVGCALLLAAWCWLPGEYDAEEARVALRDARYLQAADWALQGLEKEGANPDLYFYLGEARLAQGLRMLDPVMAQSFFDGAAEAFADGRRLFPQDTRLALRLGGTLDELSRFDEAEAALRDALRWDPNSGRAWTYYAQHLQMQGQTDAARLAYARSLALAPEPLAQAALGRLGPAGEREVRPAN